jgi:hypothetical protein
MRLRFRTTAAVLLLAPLMGCSPSKDDVAKAVGQNNISNVSCSGATGQPGYVCTFTYLNSDLTRRLVKRDDGTWEVVY